jgi:hypothetical protein
MRRQRAVKRQAEGLFVIVEQRDSASSRIAYSKSVRGDNGRGRDGRQSDGHLGID